MFVYLPHDPVWSLEALKSPCFAAHVVLVESSRITDVASGPFAVSAEQETEPLAQLLRTTAWRNVKLRPVVRIMPSAWTSWEAGEPAEPQRLADEIANSVPATADGLCLWLDGTIPDAAQASAGMLFDALHSWAHRKDIKLCVILPLGSHLGTSVNLKETADTIIVLGFRPREHGTGPSPPVDRAWFENSLDAAVAEFGRQKLVLALGTFAEDWAPGGLPWPDRIPYWEAMQRTAHASGTVGFDQNNLLATARYSDARGRQHQLTIRDAVSAYNEMKTAEGKGVEQFAVWDLGYEDPDIWKVLRMPASLPTESAAKSLSEVNLKDYVSYTGSGAFLRLISGPRVGYRTVEPLPRTGLLRERGYSVLPRPVAIERYGRSFAPVVALTFDDGPDPQFTPAILDILAEKGVPGTFFQVGANVVNSPAITQRIVNEGHEVGSHTFFHPRLENVSNLWANIELNAFQRVLASVTGHRTLLFRTPYGRSEGPISGDEARPLLLLDRLGYIDVGSDITPRDWEGLPASKIVDFVRERLADGAGNVLVMHDAGGDRHTTIEALPRLIDQLRADGYRFVSLADLLGTDRSALMPQDLGPRTDFDAMTFSAMRVLGQAFKAIFWIAVVLGASRSLTILVLALLRGRHRDRPGRYAPPVTVLIPAFNEDDVILDCVSAVLASDYEDLSVIIIDDGSVDHTLEEVREVFGADPRVTIMTEPNQGKWMALDNAYDHVKTEIVVAIDADALIGKDAIARLVRPLEDPAVGAVAGNVRVRNEAGILTRLQSLEYVTAQNIDRRAAELFNGIIVVPGALGAWRVQAVREAGFYSSQTLTEDADLTVSVLRCGYRVVYEEGAFSYTEVPRTVGGFLRQRLRWIFGMIQTAWKHRRAAFERRPVGLISIPDLFAFGVLLPLLAPVTDLVFLATVADIAINFLSGRETILHTTSLSIVVGYLTLPAMDLAKMVVALGYERTARLSLILVWPFQRLFYQPLLYFTVYRSVYRALTGKLAEWGTRLKASAPSES